VSSTPINPDARRSDQLSSPCISLRLAANALKIFGVYLVFDTAVGAVSSMKHDQNEGHKAVAELAKLRKNAKAAGVEL